MILGISEKCTAVPTAWFLLIGAGLAQWLRDRGCPVTQEDPDLSVVVNSAVNSLGCLRQTTLFQPQSPISNMSML